MMALAAGSIGRSEYQRAAFTQFRAEFAPQRFLRANVERLMARKARDTLANDEYVREAPRRQFHFKCFGVRGSASNDMWWASAVPLVESAALARLHR